MNEAAVASELKQAASTAPAFPSAVPEPVLLEAQPNEVQARPILPQSDEPAKGRAA